MNEARAIRLFHAITQISDTLIEEASGEALIEKTQGTPDGNIPKKKASAPKKLPPWAAAAACLCLLLAALSWQSLRTAGDGRPGPEPSLAQESAQAANEGVTIPPMQPSLNAGALADMIRFFIYQGRCYAAYGEPVAGRPELRGDYLGTATGLIDEWTPADGYVELAGSVKGDFYALNGYDPAFLLCMDEGGALRLYACNNGITLVKGSELYEERLHLAENYESVQYENRASWFYGLGDIRTLADPQNDALREFLKALNQAVFQPDQDICFQGGEVRLYETVSDSELGHLFFQMKDGTCVELRIHEGGYVRFEGILNACLRVPADVFASLCDWLEADG